MHIRETGVLLFIKVPVPAAAAPRFSARERKRMPAAEKEDPLDSGAIIVAEYHGKASSPQSSPNSPKKTLRKQSQGYVCARPRLGDGPKVGGVGKKGIIAKFLKTHTRCLPAFEDTREWATKSIF